jgi:hypothetical protein
MRLVPLRTSLAAVLALSLGLVSAVPGQPQGAAPAVEDGMVQVVQGRWSEAVITLDAVIARLLPARATRGSELARAYLFRGVALAALAQDAKARESFTQALALDPTLRPGDTFPARALTLFEDARKGSAAAPLPAAVASPAPAASAAPAPSASPVPAASPAPPARAGGGTLGLVQILGVTAIAGGAAVAGAVSLGDSTVPIDTQPGCVSGGVETGTFTGPGLITFVTATPTVGCPVACGTSCDNRVNMLFNLRSDVDVGTTLFTVSLFDSQGQACLRGQAAVDLFVGQPIQSSVSFQDTGLCTLPFTVVSMGAQTNSGQITTLTQQFLLTYSFIP